MSNTLLKSLTTRADIRQIITVDYAGKSFSQLEDLQGEITDGVMPIYYGDIIGEWQAMPSEYDGEGVAEFGLPEPEKITVYRLMELDLYAYYSNLVASVLWELQDEGCFDESEAVSNA
jgi:hypothetical protein